MFDVNKWLDDNELSIKIFNNKYRRDSETDDEWLERVSGGDKYLADMIEKHKFIFGGRILANRGKKQTTSNCFTGDSLVYTERGIIPIKDVVVGDKVITAGGTWENVNAVMERDYVGDIFVVKSKYIIDDIKCTPNHKFLTDKGWVRADRLGYLERHKLATPICLSTGEKDTNYGLFDLMTINLGENKTIVESGEGIQYRVNHQNHSKSVWRLAGNPIKRYIDLDNKDVRYFIGRWLGDGSVTKRKDNDVYSITQIVFNREKEEDVANRIIEIARKHFNIEPSVRYTNQNVIAVRLENPILGEFFFQMFGHGCSGKFVPDKFIGDFEMLKGLLDSDGSINSHGAVKLVLKNKSLIEWTRRTLYINGIYCSNIKTSDRYDDTYEISVPSAISRYKLTQHLTKTYFDARNNITRDDDKLSEHIDISEINILDNQECKVYNLSVENDHSYCVNGVFVHNCFIFEPVEDSIDSIMDTCSKMARTYKAGGGVGFALDNIRPKGAKINHQENTHPGMVYFMQLFSSVTGTIKGNARNGALMLMLDAEHPDVMDFIHSKKDKNNGITNANISVKISDEFMQKAQDGVVEKKIYHVESTGQDVEYVIDYKKIFDEIVELSRTSAEPGIAFWSKMSNYNLCNVYNQYNIVGINPCGEVSGIAYDACLLGSLNLAEYVDGQYGFNFPEFSKDVQHAVYSLNQVQKEGISQLPLEEQKKTASDTHQIGLGVMGVATMLIKMGIRYGSPESVEILERIMSTMFNNAVLASSMYAVDHGTFTGYDFELTKQSAMWDLLDVSVKAHIQAYGLYNLKVLSIAPTGTISTLLNVSSGVEPYYALNYTRTTESIGGKKEVHTVNIPIVEDWLSNHNGQPLPDYFIDSNHINYKDRIAVQAILQRYVDNSISSTINLPKGTTSETVKNLYLEAWKQGLKGVTIYVDGSLDTQVLNIDAHSTPPKDKDIVYKERIISIGCGKIRMLIGYDRDTKKIHDYFTIRTGTGGCGSNINSFAIVASKYIKKGGDLNDLLASLEGSEGCNSFSSKRGSGVKLSKGKNCATAMLNALIDFQKEVQEIQEVKPKPIKIKPLQKKTEDKPTVQCQICGEQMVSEGHCYVCKSCGNTYCD